MRNAAAGRGDWLLLLDFDGTLTFRDVDFEVADALLPPGRERAYEPLAHRYERLEIGLPEYFEGYLALLAATPAEIARAAAAVRLRPGVDRLLATIAALGVEVRIVSEGVDAYVHPVLSTAGLGAVPVSCNRAVHDPETGRWQVTTAADGEPCARCLNCKGAHARRARAAGRRVAIVGNGASDLCGARLADLVVARDNLAHHCDREGLPYVPWTTLEDVQAALRARVGATE